MDELTRDQTVVLLTMGGALALFVWGRFRHDLVALFALLALVFTGIVSGHDAFAGFGHPAVITVAAVLVISRGIRNAGIVDLLAQGIERVAKGDWARIGALGTLAAAISAFINNVGSLALLMPVALGTARKSNLPASRLLMPLSFSAILGGMMTMIGTPPNVIIAAYREEIAGEPFRLFDFFPVGGLVALAGVVFVIGVGWRMIPTRRGKASPEELFRIQEYITEATLPEASEWAGRPVSDLESISDGEVAVVAIVRGAKRLPAPMPRTVLRAGDVLVLRADPADLPAVIEKAGLELEGESRPGAEVLRSEDVGLIEAVVPPGSRLVGRTPRSLGRPELRLLAAARQGEAIHRRLNAVRFQAGDVLLVQGPADELASRLTLVGLLPLEQRHLRVGKRRRPLVVVGVFAAALAASATGLLPAAVSLVAVAVAFVAFDLVSPRVVYRTVDWPVIILLGAMIPVGAALESTGATELAARGLLGLTGALPLAGILAIVLIVTMTLSDVINNAATAVVMAPLAVTVAEKLGASADPFLMAVAVGASCAFLTPIGHQCNTLVMGPGGYRFGDYWRMGLPLEVLIVLVSIPAILRFWPV